MNQLPFLSNVTDLDTRGDRRRDRETETEIKGAKQFSSQQGKISAVCKCWADTVSWNISASKSITKNCPGHISLQNQTKKKPDIRWCIWYCIKQTKQTEMLSFIVLCFYGLVSCKTRVQCWSDISWSLSLYLYPGVLWPFDPREGVAHKMCRSAMTLNLHKAIVSPLPIPLSLFIAPLLLIWYISHQSNLSKVQAQYFLLSANQALRPRHSLSHTRTRTHSHMRTPHNTHIHSHTRTHARAHTHTHAHTHARTHTHTHTHARSHARTHTHAHTHARTHERTHTHHTHTHTSWLCIAHFFLTSAKWHKLLISRLKLTCPVDIQIISEHKNSSVVNFNQS